jgi:hypothetical protein
MSDVRRIDVGFKGGPVLSVRIAEGDYEKLVKALADDKSGRWHTLDTDDSSVLVDLAQIVYVQRESGDLKVGF